MNPPPLLTIIYSYLAPQIQPPQTSLPTHPRPLPMARHKRHQMPTLHLPLQKNHNQTLESFDRTGTEMQLAKYTVVTVHQYTILVLSWPNHPDRCDNGFRLEFIFNTCSRIFKHQEMLRSHHL